MTEEEKLFYLAYSKTVNLVNELLPNIKELYENEYDILELIFIPFYDESMNQTVFAEKFNQSQLIELPRSDYSCLMNPFNKKIIFGQFIK